jgi:hypothetical protein
VALDREIDHLRELLTALLKADVESLKAAEEQHEHTHAQEAAEALAARDAALQAALAAEKEATAKAEAATTKQLDALTKNFDVEIKALRDLIDDVKLNANSRAVEVGAAGGRVAGKEYVWGVVLIILALVLSFIGIVFTR